MIQTAHASDDGFAQIDKALAKVSTGVRGG
jgi:hypothetical protein